MPKLGRLWALFKHNLPGNYDNLFIASFCTISIIVSLLRPNSSKYPHITLELIKYDLINCNATRLGSQLEFCEAIPSNLELFKPAFKGDVKDTELSQLAIELKIEPGGKWSPTQCIARHSVAVIVPQRGRESQLKIFLHHIHEYLQKQLLDYEIFVVEQTEEHGFNKGVLYNAAFLEIQKRRSNFCCFILNDVDLLPESPKNIYACSKNPRHLCASLDTFRYTLIYPELFGGVVSLTKQQYKTANGFSNQFWGWGGEDDDLYNRVKAKGMDITRWDPNLSRYTMVPHPKETFNPIRNVLVKSGINRQDEDGVNNVNYKLVKTDEFQLYTRFLIQVIPP